MPRQPGERTGPSFRGAGALSEGAQGRSQARSKAAHIGNIITTTIIIAGNSFCPNHIGVAVTICIICIISSAEAPDHPPGRLVDRRGRTAARCFCWSWKVKLIADWGVESERLDRLLDRGCPYCGSPVGRPTQHRAGKRRCSEPHGSAEVRRRPGGMPTSREGRQRSILGPLRRESA